MPQLSSPALLPAEEVLKVAAHVGTSSWSTTKASPGSQVASRGPRLSPIRRTPDGDHRCRRVESVSLAVELAAQWGDRVDRNRGRKDRADFRRAARRSGPMMGSVRRSAVVEAPAGSTSTIRPVGPASEPYARSSAHHPRTAALIADLSARAEQFLAGLRMSDQATEVLAFGSALEVVERELAAADRMRVSGARSKIRRPGRSWTLDPASAVCLPGDTVAALPECCQGYPGPGLLRPAATEYGILIAVVDPDRVASDGRGRRSRPPR